MFCFLNVSSMKEPLAREPHWLPSGAMLHVGGFILSHLFSPRRFLIKSVPGVAFLFFFCMRFDSAEMRFLCGDIRCSHLQRHWRQLASCKACRYRKIYTYTEWYWKYQQLSAFQSVTGVGKAMQERNTFSAVFTFILTDQLRLKMIPSCKNLTSLFHTIFPQLSFQRCN